MAHLVIDQSGKIIAASEFAFPASVVEFYQQQGCTIENAPYEHGYDGQLYRAGEAPQKTPEQIAQEEADARRAEILQELADLDAQGARASRGIALAYAAGETPDAADVTRLTEVEDAAKALRTELAAL